jgi:hypothetical protein
MIPHLRQHRVAGQTPAASLVKHRCPGLQRLPPPLLLLLLLLCQLAVLCLPALPQSGVGAKAAAVACEP